MRGSLLSRVRGGRKGLFLDVFTHIAQMTVHLRVGLVAVAQGDGGRDGLVKTGIDGLALETVRVFAQSAPPGIALTGAHGVEKGQEKRVAGRFGNGSVT